MNLLLPRSATAAFAMRFYLLLCRITAEKGNGFKKSLIGG